MDISEGRRSKLLLTGKRYFALTTFKNKMKRPFVPTQVSIPQHHVTLACNEGWVSFKKEKRENLSLSKENCLQHCLKAGQEQGTS